MTTVAAFDFDHALDRLLEALAEMRGQIVAGLEEVAGEVHDLQVALLTVEQNDHRQAHRLLQEMVALLTADAFKAAVHRDWIRQAQALVPPLEDPLPTAEDVHGIRTPEGSLPVIQVDEE